MQVKRVQLALGTLLVLTAIAYWHLIGNGFVALDDDIYITGNRYVQAGLSIPSVMWAFAVGTDTYWHPLTWLSLMVDTSLFGTEPSGYHITNLALHLANASLVYAVLLRLSGAAWTSLFVAALFAVHPVNVEAVAWAVERKTLLCTFFLLLTLRAYAHFVRRPSSAAYWRVCILFAMSLMAKPAGVALPVLLLFLDFWPLKRYVTGTADASERAPAVQAGDSSALSAGPSGSATADALPTSSARQLLLEKIPLLALSVASVAMSIASLDGGLRSSAAEFGSLSARAANATIAYVAYLGKLAWPAGLAAYYPPVDVFPSWQIVAAGGLIVGVTAVVLIVRDRRPWLAVGWFWYLAAMFPVSGLVRAGLWPAMADRFLYLPALGVFVAVAWECKHLAERRPQLSSSIIVAGTALCTGLAVVTFNQVGYWRNSIALFERMLAVTGPNLLAHNNLGHEYLLAGQVERGLEHLKKAQLLDATNVRFELAKASMALEQGDRAMAERWLLDAVDKSDGAPAAYDRLAYFYEKSGNLDRAIAAYHGIVWSRRPGQRMLKERARQAIARLTPHAEAILQRWRERLAEQPDNPAFLGDLALSLDRLGFYDEALRRYEEMLRAGGDGWQIRYNIARVLGKIGRDADSARAYRRSLELNPANPDAYNNLGLAYRMVGDDDAAIRSFEQAIVVDPGYAFAHFNLAVTHYKRGDYAEASRRFDDVMRRFPALRERVSPYLVRLAR